MVLSFGGQTLTMNPPLKVTCYIASIDPGLG